MPQPKMTARRLRLSALLTVLIALSALLACGVSPTLEPALSATPAVASPEASEATPTAAPPTATRVARDTPTPTATREPTAPPTAVVKSAPDPGPAPAFALIGQAAADYLTTVGGDSTALAAAIEHWGMAADQAEVTAYTTGPNLIEADLTGDGRLEVILAVANPEPEMLPGEGALIVLAPLPGGYAAVYDSLATDGQVGPALVLSTEDATGDGLPDVAFGLEYCGAHTCSVDVRVLSHEASGYVNLAQGILIAYPDSIELRDLNGDGTLEIIATGGEIGSVGAGVQRASTVTYKLDGDRYKLARVEWAPSDLLLFKVEDANAALATGRLDEAVALYQQALTDETLVASGLMQNGMTPEQETEALYSFARFRLVVTHGLRGDAAAAEAAYRDASAAGGPYAQLAQAFWRYYAGAGDVGAGCENVTAYALEVPELLDILNAFGYANPFFAEMDICAGAGQGAVLPETSLG